MEQCFIYFEINLENEERRTYRKTMLYSILGINLKLREGNNFNAIE